MLGGDRMEDHKPNKNAGIGGGCAHKGAGGLATKPTTLCLLSGTKLHQMSNEMTILHHVQSAIATIEE